MLYARLTPRKYGIHDFSSFVRIPDVFAFQEYLTARQALTERGDPSACPTPGYFLSARI